MTLHDTVWILVCSLTLAGMCLAEEPPVPRALPVEPPTPRALPVETPTPLALNIPEPYTPMDFSQLLGMDGFSGTALSNHFKLYHGYVNNVNTLSSALRELLAGRQETSPQYAELKRRLGWEFNGMRLHEYYFENLGGTGVVPTNSALYAQITADFGNLESWRRDFIGTGKMRGIGWVIMYYDLLGKRLVNMWINEHDSCHIAGGVPVLVMDVFEHAYMPDYELDRASYIEAFMRNINWDIATHRFPQ